MLLVIMVSVSHVYILQSIFHIHMICQRMSKRLVRGRVFLCLPRGRDRLKAAQWLTSYDKVKAQSPLILEGDTLAGVNVLLLLVASLHASCAIGSLLGFDLTLLLFTECLANWVFFLMAHLFNSYCEIGVRTGECAKESE